MFSSVRRSIFGGEDESTKGLPMTPLTAASTPSSVPSSPFFAPSSKTPVISSTLTTPGGTKRLRRRKDKAESKSSVSGASFNLINGIVGAGIVGIPFAVKEAGLLSGIVMIIMCAALTVKSLRLLIATAKHIDVNSYETLLEASFGKFGFYFISIAMLSNAYGAMVSYLMIVRETLPTLLGYASDDRYMARVVLTVSTLIIIFPLSMQRDMAALSKTSIVSVCFDLIMVAIVIVISPVKESMEKAGGIHKVLETSTFRPETFFVGVGVLSFAFVCQHASFIIAGSLDRPTKDRWNVVTGNALLFCGTLATLCGTVGYLGFLDETDGNILNNLGRSPYAKDSTYMLAMLARGLMCTCMFFVYPIESFVARHVLIVLFFKGRKAHEGDDHAVLARKDRRVALTLFLYLMALVPALLVESLGPVLAISGSLGGSSLSYIGPGAAYLAVHGKEFFDMVRERWGIDSTSGGEGSKTSKTGKPSAADLAGFVDRIWWYVTFMPLWCGIAATGVHYLAKHEEEEALKSPHIGRLGKIVHHHKGAQQQQQQQRKVHPPIMPPGRRASNESDEEGGGGRGENAPLIRADSMPKTMPGGGTQFVQQGQYGAAGQPQVMTGMGNRGIAAAIAAQNAAKGSADADTEGEEDPQEEPPTILDYSIAIFLFVFGLIAATAGMISTLA